MTNPEVARLRARIKELEREVRAYEHLRKRLWRLHYAEFLAPHYPKGAKAR